MTPPEIVLRLVVALLPPRRREWGRAMRAELATVDGRSARWSFVLSCLRATVAQTSPQVTGGVVASAAAIGGVVVVTARTGYVPLRWTLIAYVALLVAIAWSARLPWLAPAGPRAGRVRFAGVVLVSLLAASVVTGLDGGGNPFERVTTGVPIFAVLSGCYLLAVVLATAGDRGADRRGADRAALVGAASGVTAGLLWTAGVLLFPPVPAGVATALLSIAIAAVVAIAIALRRTDGPALPARFALMAAATCALVIGLAVRFIAVLAPVRFIPLLPAGAGPITPAARVAQSRTELDDPYVAVLMAGALVAIVLVGTVLATRRADAQPTPTSEIAASS